MHEDFDVAEYKVIWVQVNLTWNAASVQEIPLVTETINQYAKKGWRLFSLVPGTNAQTHHGVFVTLVAG